MIPNIFVSSTIADLQHLRDAVRDTIVDLGYNPILSEYGDIGYLPSVTAEDSCYISIRDCQISVVVIGKRYGSLSSNGFSVTQNEFRQARELGVPVLCLVDQEVLSFKRIYDANPKPLGATFPGMDDPERTFGFIQEIMDSPVNNGILSFTNASSARHYLKRQLAHLFGELLRQGYSPMKGEVQDVLSEIKTLRHELLKNQEGKVLPFLKAVRFLVDGRNRAYRDLLEKLGGNIEAVVPMLLECKTFEDFLSRSCVKLVLDEDIFLTKEEIDSQSLELAVQEVADLTAMDEKSKIARWGLLKTKGGRELRLNEAAKKLFELRHQNFLKTTQA